MRGRGTALLFGALALLAGLAVADSVRDAVRPKDADPRTSDEATRTDSTQTGRDARRQLANGGLRGSLYASVLLEDGCSFRALGLPALESLTFFQVGACRFVLDDRAHDVAFGERCPARLVEVRRLGSDDGVLFPGCAPAWNPDGRLTFVRDGDVVAAERVACARHASCRETLFSRRELEATLQPLFDPRFANRFAFREIDWFTSNLLVAVVATFPRREEFLATWRAGRLVGPPEVFAPSFTRLRVLPQRQEAVVATVNGFGAVRPDGQFIGRRTTDVRALAYAPDERAYASATSEQVCFYASTPTNADIACIPLAVADLEWRR